jgi:hypoxanthine phosphoribosyltransferase
VVANPVGAVLPWLARTQITSALGERVRVDGHPEVLVGVLRGGMVPAVLLAHALGLRAVRAVEVTHTTAEGAGAAKSARPAVHRPDGSPVRTGYLAGKLSA